MESKAETRLTGVQGRGHHARRPCVGSAGAVPEMSSRNLSRSHVVVVVVVVEVVVVVVAVVVVVVVVVVVAGVA